MSNLTDLQNRYNEGDKMTNLEMLVIIAQDETAADELAALNKVRANAETVIKGHQMFGVCSVYDLSVLDVALKGATCAK